MLHAQSSRKNQSRLLGEKVETNVNAVSGLSPPLGLLLDQQHLPAVPAPLHHLMLQLLPKLPPTNS